MTKNIVLIALLTAGVWLAGVRFAFAQQTERVPELPETPHEYATITLPPYFNMPNIRNADNTPANNPITNDGATLGRVLFYDVALSANDTVSCASCHQQENGFSDSATLSTGFDGELTGRHSMGLANARYYNNGNFFWDERADTLEIQVLMPIQDPVEMGMNLTMLETKLATLDYYPDLFEAAFGTPDITSDRISRAMAQFIRSMLSYESKFDEGLATNFANFTPQERQGRNIFNNPQAGGCAFCHNTELQIAPVARNNGLDSTFTDLGLGAVTGNPADNGKFKSPSLRNIGLTAPYMHDGRFGTLEQVVQHYNNGVQNSPTLDQRLRGNNGQPRRLNLDQNEQAALVAFLNTLTDNSFTTDERFSDPFVEVIPTSVGLVANQATTPHTTFIVALLFTAATAATLFTVRQQKRRAV